MSRAKFSTATARTGGCPRCGSTAFTAKRSMTGKVMLGVLAPKTQVRCIGCKTTYART